MKQLKTKQVLRKGMKYAFALSLVASSFLPGAGFTDKIHAESHVDNPYQGATKYVNPDYAASVDTSIAKITDANLKAKMQTVKTFPTAVWLDRIAAINGGGGKLYLKRIWTKYWRKRKATCRLRRNSLCMICPDEIVMPWLPMVNCR